MNTVSQRIAAAFAAVLTTVIALAGVGGIADHQHRDVVAATESAQVVAAAGSAVQQVVIVGRRTRG